MLKILSLDIGITSVGWAIIDDQGNIIDVGVRLFDESNPKDNLKRRASRGSRRMIRRRKQRSKELFSFLINIGLITEDFKPLGNPYELRKKGLKEQLSNEELATILLNYSKRRGSSLETVEEEGKNEVSTKTILNRNSKELINKDFIVNIQLDRLNTKGKVRGIDNNFSSNDYLNEINEVLKHQTLSVGIADKIKSYILRRRHYSHGPGSIESPSKYGRFREVGGELFGKLVSYIKENNGQKYKKERFDVTYNNIDYVVLKNGSIINKEPLNLINLMRGRCSIYQEELRAPKLSFSAELFNLLNDLNNLTINNRDENKLSLNEKNMVIDYVRSEGNITYTKFMKLLGFGKDEISGFRLGKEDKPILTEFIGYKKISDVFKKNEIKIPADLIIDKISDILTLTQVIDERKSDLGKLFDNHVLVAELSELSGFNKYHNLSLKAIYKLNDEIINTSLNQQQIITKLGLKNNNEQSKLVLSADAILSPVARRAQTQALKLVERLMKEHGHFERIIVETTRSKNSDDERKRIKEANAKNIKNKKEALETIKNYPDERLNATMVLKLRLYKEQDGKCIYTGLPIDLSKMIRDHKAYEIDHIIPISISFDDSYNNKVLVLHGANQKKQNKTPFGYFSRGDLVNGTKIKDWNSFEKSVSLNKNISARKKANLLFAEDITKYEVISKFINRNLVDTSYAVRVFMTTLKQYFEANDIDTKVITIKGQQTRRFRNTGLIMWARKHKNQDELNPFKKDRDNYIHHAMDALIMAGLANQKDIRKLYRLSEHVDEETGEVTKFADLAEDDSVIKYLMNIAKIKEEDVKFSWKIDTKPNRFIVNDTICSASISNGMAYELNKVNIYELKNKDIKKLLFNDYKNVLMYINDKRTFDKFVHAYKQYENEKYPMKVFYEKHGYITKYSKKNSNIPVKSIKVIGNKISSDYIDLSNKYEKCKSNPKIVFKKSIKPFRVDMYFNGTRYRFVTLRYIDFKKRENKYYIEEEKYKLKKIEKAIDSTYDFCFSLYKNSTIQINDDVFRFIGVVDKENKFEVKKINKIDKDSKGEPIRIRPVISKNTKYIGKFNISITGKVSKVDKEPLKLSI
ncbi:MAG: type II CRISPR RNA-guided endonuclease Cas9 [Acholeplasma sp.]|nr:type II CRISPR RNA-guided endonuclease Cas9 [Acholeplasma sp.]